jgi:hypothetical protein
MTKHNGSAFVGLIVCIATAVFGAGVMLPNILRARQQATAVQCMSNLKQIGIATINYVQDFRGYLPPCTEAGRSPLRQGVRSFSAGNLLKAEDLANYAPPVARSAETVNDPGANVFTLNIDGYLGKWQRPGRNIQAVAAAAADRRYLSIRFCPDQPDKWGEIAEKFGSSYLYNPHWMAVDGNYWAGKMAEFPGAANLKAIDPPVTVWYRKLSDYPREAALCTDMIYDGQLIAHRMGAGSAHWNLLFADAHVASVNDSLVAGQLSNTGDVGTGMDELKGLEDYLDVLETEAAGRDPMRETLLAPRTINQQTPLRDREVEAKRDKTVKYY